MKLPALFIAVLFPIYSAYASQAELSDIDDARMESNRCFQKIEALVKQKKFDQAGKVKDSELCRKASSLLEKDQLRKIKSKAK